MRWGYPPPPSYPRWMTALLLLLVALNDPLYIMRVVLGGNQTMYNVSVLAQIAFSGGLFLFCLAYADGLNRTGGERPICTFYLPKLVLVSAYVLSAAAVFVLHGRVPDRISVSEGAGGEQQLLVLIGSLTASLLGVGAWLSFLVARAVYRLGWKKVCRKHIKAPDSSHPRTQTLPRETWGGAAAEPPRTPERPGAPGAPKAPRVLSVCHGRAPRAPRGSAGSPRHSSRRTRRCARSSTRSARRYRRRRAMMRRQLMRPRRPPQRPTLRPLTSLSHQSPPSLLRSRWCRLRRPTEYAKAT